LTFCPTISEKREKGEEVPNGLLCLPSATHRLADEQIGPCKVPLDDTGLGRLAQNIDDDTGD